MQQAGLPPVEVYGLNTVAPLGPSESPRMPKKTFDKGAQTAPRALLPRLSALFRMIPRSAADCPSASMSGSVGITFLSSA